MTTTPSMTAPSTRASILVGLLLAAAGVATFLAGRVPVSIYIALLMVAAYHDLRRLLGPWGSIVTFVLGGAGVLAFLWSGYSGDLELLPATGAALMIALLTSRVALQEAGRVREGITGDLAATIGAAGVVGVLGAHVLLIRAVPRVGFRGLLVFGLMVIASDVAAFVAGRIRGRHPIAAISPQKTWEGAAAAFAASTVVGLIAGFVVDPPFDVVSGLAFGAGVGVLAPVGDLAFTVIERSAGTRRSGIYLGSAGGVLDQVDSLIFAAPAFYWAYRTIAL